MAAKHFYAHHNRYGVGTVYQRPDGSLNPHPGGLYRFGSRAARDAWVADDSWDGQYHREAIPASVVRAAVESEKRRGGQPQWENVDSLTGETHPYEWLTY